MTQLVDLCTPPITDHNTLLIFISGFYTLSEEIAQSTVYHHPRQICVYLHFAIMHKVI